MSAELLFCIGTIFFLAAIGTPIAYSIIMGAIVYLAMAGSNVSIASMKILDGLNGSFILLAVPLFIVAANIMNAGTISTRLLQFCIALVGRFKGGMGHVNIVSSVIFAGMSGSAVADAAGMGKLVIDMMKQDGKYSRGYAAAITAASATIGPIIPPSIPMVLYALVSGTSIGALFLGGIVPGLLMALVLMVMNAIISNKRGYGEEEKVPWSEMPKRTVEAFPALLMPAILLYGIYGGAMTPTEAAAVAALYSLLIAAVLYRSIKASDLYDVLVKSVRSSASVGLVIGGAFVLNYIVASENIPTMLSNFIGDRDISPIMFILSVNLLLLVLGCLLDTTTIILVIIPLFIPTCRELGIDLVYFGVVCVVNCMLGLITPPYGMLLFVINAVNEIPLNEIIREIWPFLTALIIALLVMIFVPEIVLWLPKRFGYDG